MTHDSLPGSSSPVDIAMKAIADGDAVENPARILLAKQNRLIDAQVRQLGRMQWRDVIITLLGLILLGGALLFIWSARQANGVVVEAFAVPPAFVERGLNGAVVASHLLDKLTAMQGVTVSLRASSSYANNWGDDIKVEVPYAGISVGELQRMLREWLGSQTQLSGEVVRLPDGRISLTSRIGNKPPTRAEGTDAELDALMQKAAEAIYGETQPYRYAIWLRRAKRMDEATTLLTKMSQGTDLNDRIWAYNGLGAATPIYADKIRHYYAALALRPDFAPAISNLVIAETAVGHEEEAYQRALQLEKFAGAMRRELEPGRADFPLAVAKSTALAAVGDYAGAAKVDKRNQSFIGSPANMRALPLLVASDLAQAHELGAASKALADEGLSSREKLAERVAEAGDSPIIAFAKALDDWTQAREQLLAELRARTMGNAAPPPDPDYLIRAELAAAQARTGQIAEAFATIGPTPSDCAPCTRARAIVLSFAGRHAEADRMFARALAQTPSLPLGHQAYAEALVRRGDAPGAIAQARLAVKKGPRWAETHQILGEALMLAGKGAEALGAYAAAAQIAPRWGTLHIAWGDALWRTQSRPAALEMWRKAARMPLSAKHAARVNQRMASARMVMAR